MRQLLILYLLIISAGIAYCSYSCWRQNRRDGAILGAILTGIGLILTIYHI